MKRFLYLSMLWAKLTVIIIWKSHKVMPVWLRVISVVFTVWLLSFTLVQQVFIVWYSGSFIWFHISKTYRERYFITVDILDEALGW